MENMFKYNDIMRFVNNEYKKLYSVEKYDGKEKIITIPDTYESLIVYEIGNECFRNNEIIEEVVLPSSVGSIGSSAFSFCKNLKKINLDRINYIDVSSFAYSGIEEIKIDNISEIGMAAFSNCENLKEVIIGGSIKEIKSDTFVNCKNLKKVILPDTVEKIGDNAFSGCKKIEEICVPKNAKISKYAFEKSTLELIKNNKKEKKQIDIIYNLEYLLSETKKMKKEEIELYIKDLLKQHKLDSFDTSDITDMNNIGFNKETGELSWNCTRCGYCTCDLWDLLANKGKMIDKFDISGCGYCG